LSLFDPHSRDIIFSLTYFNEMINVASYEGEYRNLMVLINEKIYVEDFGECKGIGRCGTCLVEVSGPGVSASVIERNENATLSKCANGNQNLRLACQIMINSALNGATIKIVEEREDVGDL
jgi:ferredoxin, 2Fe-2S